MASGLLLTNKRSCRYLSDITTVQCYVKWRVFMSHAYSERLTSYLAVQGIVLSVGKITASLSDFWPGLGAVLRSSIWLQFYDQGIDLWVEINEHIIMMDIITWLSNLKDVTLWLMNMRHFWRTCNLLLTTIFRALLQVGPTCKQLNPFHFMR